MFEKFLIEQCSSTLAGLKPANLFSYTGPDRELVPEYIRFWNQKLNPRGVFLTVLHRSGARVLVYVYRRGALSRELARPGAADFLAGYGYDCSDLSACIGLLRDRIAQAGIFPHEIGLFLGYPLEDVTEFIKNRGQNCKCCGFWKVYSNEGETKKLFTKYVKCRQIYIRLFCGGRSVVQLTIAAS